MRLIRNKRITYGWLILTVLIAILTMRLAWVQLVMKHQRVPGSRHTMVEASLIQRERGIVLDSGRGHFTDRNGKPLTGNLIWTAVLFPAGEKELKGAHHQVAKLARILGTDKDQLLETWGKLKEPQLWHGADSRIPRSLSKQQIEQIRELELPKLKVLPYEQRYGNRLSGMQWLGFVSGQRKESLFFQDYPEISGTSGLEKTMDSLIRGEGPTIVYFPVNSTNEVIQDMKPMVKAPDNRYYPLRVSTTIDIDIQRGIEAITEKAGMREGAVVVLDARNADIVAMVSRPFYNPEQIHPKDGQWENRGLKAATPGSVFKLVTAAAILENGLSSPNEHFHCDGEFGKFGLSCWKKGGHGTIDLREGFAESCNVVFATLAERLTPQQMTSAASALGFGQTVGWQSQGFLGLRSFAPLDHEEKGTVFSGSVDASDAGVRVQTGIGQRDAAVSPLQAANAVVTLLHGGVKTKPRIMKQIRYANGQLLQDTTPLSERPLGNGISRETSSILLEWMEDVVQEGTGSSLKNRKWTLAGKSGTAQVKVKGRARNNQWFVGYGPVEKPRYAVAVLVENRSTNSSNQATEIFGQVSDFLASVEAGSGSA
ncbi:peptidoglycan D,D-transpeptidase FtsI family protein [Paenibacillus lautus]|uniref:Penicillin-binding protein 2 n=1 Tax=Paenibacillus lautus TaxID=1401 RepID=A0A385TT93_PAELA|nr:penicillin-binding protein 2 [Paenibacillus lautus]AYB45732.1 penicillin-binding protein 2 [Paenibacillus lautus]